MKDIPILMCGEMVRATLEDRKTNTRRLNNLCTINRSPDSWELYHPDYKNLSGARGGQPAIPFQNKITGDVAEVNPPWYRLDRLWVRETWRPLWDDFNEPGGLGDCVQYKADMFKRKPPLTISDDEGFRFSDMCSETPNWKPSIFMPRYASRITLEITSVKVERVQDISAQDSIAEGIRIEKGSGLIDGEDCYMMTTNSGYMRGPAGAIAAFHNLWDSINDKRGFGWKMNPWVWVVQFRRVK